MTKTHRIRNGLEARLGIDGVWRLWESKHFTDVYTGQAWSHVHYQMPGATWVVIDTDRELVALVDRHRGLSETQLSHVMASRANSTT